jgi:predicted membrane metal-binding protein
MCLTSFLVLLAFCWAGWLELGVPGAASFLLVWLFGALAGSTAMARKLNGELP